MKRWIPVAGGSVFLLLLLLVILLLPGRSDESTVDTSRYTDRDLIVPGLRFLLPDIEESLMNPGIRYTIDPDQPLDPEVLQRVEADLFEALWEELVPRVERDVEELLFD